MIQLMVRKPLGDLNNLPDQKGDKKKEEAKVGVKVAEVAESKVYKVGDGLDVRDRETGERIRFYKNWNCWSSDVVINNRHYPPRSMVRGSNCEDNEGR